MTQRVQTTSPGLPFGWFPGVLLLCWLAGGTPLDALTERHHFTVYSVREGLAQSQVTALHQDRAGYLWVGTAGGGLSRFGGREFETFTVDDGLSSNSVTAILEDRSGVLWFGTKKGLTRFEGSRYTRVELVAGSEEPSVRSLFEDRSGTSPTTKSSAATSCGRSSEIASATSGSPPTVTV